MEYIRDLTIEVADSPREHKILMHNDGSISVIAYVTEDQMGQLRDAFFEAAGRMCCAQDPGK